MGSWQSNGPNGMGGLGPSDLHEALWAEPKALDAFERSSDTYRAGLLRLVREARDRSHREHRIALVVEALLRYGPRP